MTSSLCMKLAEYCCRRGRRGSIGNGKQRSEKEGWDEEERRMLLRGKKKGRDEMENGTETVGSALSVVLT